MKGSGRRRIVVQGDRSVLDGDSLHQLEEPEESFAIPDYGAHVALELEHPRHDGVGRVQLPFVHLTPDVIGSLEGEIGLLFSSKHPHLGDLAVIEHDVHGGYVGTLRDIECE